MEDLRRYRTLPGRETLEALGSAPAGAEHELDFQCFAPIGPRRRLRRGTPLPTGGSSGNAGLRRRLRRELSTNPGFMFLRRRELRRELSTNLSFVFLRRRELRRELSTNQLSGVLLRRELSTN